MTQSYTGDADTGSLFFLLLTWFTPCVTNTLKPLYLKGSFPVITMVPFKPLEPYSAEEAPDNNSILSTSNCVSPITEPKGKFNPGAWLSIPSTICVKLVLPLVLNPLVVTEVKPKLETVTSTPRKPCTISI